MKEWLIRILLYLAPEPLSRVTPQDEKDAVVYEQELIKRRLDVLEVQAEIASRRIRYVNKPT